MPRFTTVEYFQFPKRKNGRCRVPTSVYKFYPIRTNVNRGDHRNVDGGGHENGQSGVPLGDVVNAANNTVQGNPVQTNTIE